MSKATQQFRRRFICELWQAARLIWPVLSALLIFMAAMGALVAYIEGWQLLDGVYFAFVTGLTVGYGDLVPTHGISRILAICTAGTGILLTALLAAVSVRALQVAQTENPAGSIDERG